MSTHQPPHPILNALRIILRVLLTLALVIGFAVLVFLGITRGLPFLEKTFLEPIQENSAGLRALQTSQALEKTRAGERFAPLETENAALQEELQESYDQSISLEIEIENLSATLQIVQSTARSGESLRTTQAALEEDLTRLRTQQARLEELTSYLATARVPQEEIQQDLVLLSLLSALNRAQQALLHNNYGTADEILTDTVDALTAAREDFSSPTHPLLDDLLARVESALAYLPAQPDLAREELDIAWKLLNQAFAPGGLTPTPARTSTPTPQP